MHLSNQYVDLVESGFDLAICIGELTDSSLVARRLALSQRALCASPDYFKRHGIPRKPVDLAAHIWLILRSTTGRLDSWPLRDVHDQIISASAEISGANSAKYYATLRWLAGVGIGLRLTRDIVEDRHMGRLRAVLANFPVRGVVIHVLILHRRRVPLKVRVFVDHLAAQFGNLRFRDRALAGICVRRRWQKRESRLANRVD